MAKKRRKPNNRPRTAQPPGATGTKTAERPSAPQPNGQAARSESRTRSEKKELAREARETARKRFARQQRMKRLAWAGGIGVLIAGGVLFFTRDTSTTRPAGELPGELQTEAPWPANADDAQERSEAIGLPPESPIVMHEHTNVQIFVHGESQPIPTDIGIDRSSGEPFVVSLHTHEESGTVHLESSVSRTFTLGEFFDIWGVRLSPSCMGAYCNGETDRLRVFVEGEEVTTNIRDVSLSDQEVVVITYGTADEVPDPIPVDFDFASVPQ